MSKSLPGVATITLAPLSIRSICLLYELPPYTVTVLAPIFLPYLKSSSLTCVASSRVGVITKIPTPFLTSILLRAGRPNAAVLPVPV